MLIFTIRKTYATGIYFNIFIENVAASLNLATHDESFSMAVFPVRKKCLSKNLTINYSVKIF